MGITPRDTSRSLKPTFFETKENVACAVESCYHMPVFFSISLPIQPHMPSRTSPRGPLQRLKRGTLLQGCHGIHLDVPLEFCLFIFDCVPTDLFIYFSTCLQRTPSFLDLQENMGYGVSIGFDATVIG